MQACLPREIRDMIYAHLFYRAAVQAIDFLHMFRPYPRTEAYPRPSYTCEQLGLSTPAIVKKDIVSYDVAAEAIKSMYKNSRSLEICSSEQLSEFLEADFFGVGVLAKHYKLLDLMITLDLSRSRAETGLHISVHFTLLSQRHIGFGLG